MRATAVATFLASATVSVAAAEECSHPSNAIETDRPDTTNSSTVIPVGSFQSENGINVSRQGGTQVFDGTNSRLRLGIAPCLEVLVDLPTVDTPIRGVGVSGFTNLAPASNGKSAPSQKSSIFRLRLALGCPPKRSRLLVPALNPTCSSRGRLSSAAPGPIPAW